VWAFGWSWIRCKLCTAKIKKMDWLYYEPRLLRQHKPYLMEAIK